MAMEPCVYILVSGRRGYLYTGVTSNLSLRFWQHRNGTFEGFAKRRNCTRLVLVEMFDTMIGAISREKQLKNWHRQWKINWIERSNPDWIDLAKEMRLVE